MLGIKNKEDLEKYCYEIDNSSVKESVDKLKRLNKDDVFIYDITPEEEEKYIQNTERNIAKREGLKEGLEKGLAEGLKSGKIEAQREMTINLLNENIPIEKIVAVTGLSEEEIKKYRY